MDNYLEYLLAKYFVFDKLAELHEANTIDDINILKTVNMNIKKITDENMINLTTLLFMKYRFYNISVNVGDYKIVKDSTKDIYLHYKKYKCSGNSARETETYLTINHDINTDDTYYVDSLEETCTNELQEKFGDFLNTGTTNDNFRYEYRFDFITDNKRYKFSLYDYLDDSGKFYDIKDIYWHIASNTDKKQVINRFKEYLLKMPEIDCC